jgi:predicted Zn-dependent protease
MNKKRATLICVCFVAVWSLCSCKNETFKNHYSTSQEIALGQRENEDIEHSEKMDNNPVLNQRVQTIAAPIFKQASLMRSDVNYKIAIIDSPEVNAFSIPGGWIYVYTGLLDKVGKDDDALACIIGHETAHVVRRHVVKQMSDSEVKGTLVNILGLATNNYNLYNAASAAYEFDQLHYSREDEYEADKYGLMFAYNAGYDPYGMIRFFRKLEVLEKGSGGQPAYAEDHPLTRNRIDRAMALIKLLRDNDGHYPDNVDASTAASASTLDAAPEERISEPATTVTPLPVTAPPAPTIPATQVVPK